jgi:hypothetical protein
VKYGYRKPSIKKRIAARTSLKRRIRSKYRVPRGYGWLTNPKKAAYNRVYNRTTKKACYIATAVYGDIDAYEVTMLRTYRDRILMNKPLGRLAVCVYYLVSPSLVKWFESNKSLQSVTTKLLNRLVRKIEKMKLQ